VHYTQDFTGACTGCCFNAGVPAGR